MEFLVASLLLFLCAVIENKLLFYISCFFVSLYFSVNFAYGYDWINYYSTYSEIDYAGGFVFFSEPGYAFFMKICSWANLSFPEFYFLTSSIIYLCTFFYCRSHQCKSLAFFTIFSFMGFYVFNEGIRQGLAISILLIGLVALEKNKYKTFLAIVFLACFIHISSILALIYPLILKVTHKEVKKYIIYLLFSFALLFISLSNYNLLSWLPIVGLKLESYSSSFLPSEGLLNYLIEGRILYIYLFMLLMFYFKMKANPSNKGLAISYLSILFLCMTRLSVILIRLGYFAVPLLVSGVDKYFHGKGSGLKTSLTKLTYMVLLLILSSSYVVFNTMYRDGAESHLNVMSTQGDVNKEITRKCDILNKQNANTVISSCFYSNYNL